MHHKLFIARRERRMSQQSVADHLRIDRATYSRKETGRLYFTMPEAQKLAKLFGCTLNDLFQEEETA